MEFLQEVLRNVRRLDDQGSETDIPDDLGNDEFGDEELPDDSELMGDDNDPDMEQGGEFGDEFGDEELPDDSELMGDDPTEDPMAGFSDPSSPTGAVGDESDIPSDVAPEDADDEMAGLDDVASNVNEDPDRQGVLRTVKKAHLVYKRESDAGGYEEMWIYNIGTMKDELETRKAILAGTDIPPGKTESPDGSQSYTIWSTGNAEMLCIKGLPN